MTKIHVNDVFGQPVRVGTLNVGDSFSDNGYLYGVVGKDQESMSLVTLDGERSTDNGPLTLSVESKLMVRPFLGFDDNLYLEVTNG